LRNWNNRRKSETQGETGTPWRNWNDREIEIAGGNWNLRSKPQYNEEIVISEGALKVIRTVGNQQSDTIQSK
jgi:hypothetical protein